MTRIYQIKYLFLLYNQISMEKDIKQLKPKLNRINQILINSKTKFRISVYYYNNSQSHFLFLQKLRCLLKNLETFNGQVKMQRINK